VHATVRDVDARQNTLRVELHKDRWETQYDPQRLRGVAVYETAERKFAKGDRVQLTAAEFERTSPALSGRHLRKCRYRGRLGDADGRNGR